jgi:hypothetical protein
MDMDSLAFTDVGKHRADLCDGGRLDASHCLLEQDDNGMIMRGSSSSMAFPPFLPASHNPPKQQLPKQTLGRHHAAISSPSNGTGTERQTPIFLASSLAPAVTGTHPQRTVLDMVLVNNDCL